MTKINYDKKNVTEAELINILLDNGTSVNIIYHVKKVTDVAIYIAEKLNKKGYNFDISLLKRAGILHDMLREIGRDHAEKGADIVAKTDVAAAKIIREHMVHVFPKDAEKITESDIIAISDRLTMKDKFVGIEKRSEEILGRFDGDEERKERVIQSFQEAKDFVSLIEKIISEKLLYPDNIFYKKKNKKIEAALKNVKKPGQYIGGEINSNENFSSIDELKGKLRVGFCFPDLYEIGMSFPGLQILYGLINSYDDFYMERIFVPDSDMQDEIQKKNIPLFTIESWSYVSELNVLAFTLQYELSYTNILNIFELAKIPYLSEERGDEFPLVIAGGSGTLNPEPLSLAIDLFAIGDGEESFPKILKVYKDCIEKKMTKKESLRELAKIESVFIPSMHKKGKSVKRAEISDIENVYYETSPIVPNIDAVHKRAVVEIARGCPRKCNFCQAGNAYGNMRIRSIKKILELANKIINNTGYNELSLLSFSTSDYPHFNDLIQTLEKNFERKNIFYSLPSLRLDSFDEKILMNISTYKKTGLTFAPEAGTERLRKFLNKNILDEQIFELIRKIINLGFKKVKFYFMVGLPTETYKDLEAILSLIKKCMDISYEISEKGKRNFSLQVSVSNFVPKPHTPFEREKAFSVSELYKRNYYLKDNFAKMKGVRFSFYDPKLSHIEAILSRGDSKILSIIKDAYDMGAKFDSWTEYFKYEIWEEAFKKNGIDIDRDFSFKGDEKLPWEYIKI